ncbi:hypothetical protein O181_090804 [Austropuccinia psidii MF-1]|uniref:Uncharacterized protein n=1 Tax=Austropuccinia psidii MF-1 TaxID=1389203 RepID=A0A9Q3P7A0_9BASI|nr:hypothetical protein [Austropuccinia psidii MF-1]
MSCHRWDSNAKFASRENPTATHSRPDFRKPSQTKEPPIPGPSPSSQPPEDVLTHEPEPEVAPTQFSKEPFGKSPLLFLNSYQIFLTFSLTISRLSRHSPLDNYHQQYAHRIPTFPSCSPPHQRSLPVPPRTPVPSSSHSYNEAHQEFTNLGPTLMIS